jgi:hypothetical protein
MSSDNLVESEPSALRLKLAGLKPRAMAAYLPPSRKPESASRLHLVPLRDGWEPDVEIHFIRGKRGGVQERETLRYSLHRQPHAFFSTHKPNSAGHFERSPVPRDDDDNIAPEAKVFFRDQINRMVTHLRGQLYAMDPTIKLMHVALWTVAYGTGLRTPQLQNTWASDFESGLRGDEQCGLFYNN